MKFTDENIEKAFEKARQDVFDNQQCQSKTEIEALSDEGLVRQLSKLGSAKDLLQYLIDSGDMDWAKDTRELSKQGMIDFIESVSYSEAVLYWESIDDEWEIKATDLLEYELDCIID